MTRKTKAPGSYTPSKKRSHLWPTHCQHKGCKIKLSVYNLTNYCVIHESEHAFLKDSI